MRFHRQGRYEFKDTPLKRAAFFRKQRREREAHPLFAEQIAEEQAQRPGVDEVMQQRAIGYAKGEQEDRDYRAKKWREARAKVDAYDEPARSTIRRFWNDAPYPADPVYLLDMLHGIEKGRILLDRNPPWRPTEEEIERGRAAIARYSERLKAQSGERSR